MCLPYDPRRFFFLWTLFFSVVLVSSLSARTWRSENGYTCEAEFVRFEPQTDSVVIRRIPDGKELTVKIQGLSKPDRDYLDQKRQEGDRAESVELTTFPPQMQTETGDTDQAGEVSLLTIVLVLFGLALMAIGNIWLLIVAFRESLVWGLLCLFMNGLVSLVFAITHWEDAKNPFLMQLSGLGVIVLAVVLAVALR